MDKDFENESKLNIFVTKVCVIQFWKIFIVILNYGSHFGLSNAYEKCIISLIKDYMKSGYGFQWENGTEFLVGNVLFIRKTRVFKK